MNNIVGRRVMAIDTKVEMLEAFVGGRIDIEEFSQRLSDELFQLRQDPPPSESKKLLSRIQLYLHELDEGDRDIHEIYIAAKDALDLITSVSVFVKSRINIFIPPARPGEIIPTTSSKSRAKPSGLPELQLV